MTAAIHALRVGILISIVLLVHRRHGPEGSASRPGELAFGLEEVRSILPAAAGLEPLGDERVVRDADGALLGRAVQTSPAGDGALGFSGPSNLMLVLDPAGEVLGVRLLSSGDTRDHVATILEADWLDEAFAGRSRETLRGTREVDAVSGATLSCRAMQEAVARRFGRARSSIRFPKTPALDELRAAFPEAARRQLDPACPSRMDVEAADGRPLGAVLRSSPFADDIVGYQGPSESWIVLDPEGRVREVLLHHSYDNEPYTRWVREDPGRDDAAVGRSLAELAELDLQAAGVEGISGATMTSMAMAEGWSLAARGALAAAAEPEPRPRTTASIDDLAIAALVALALGLALGSWRSRRRWTRGLQLVVIGFLGVHAVALVSQAMLLGWVGSGVPWQNAPGLVLLTAAALLVPVASGRNVYCSHLCAHGAAQQWLHRLSPWRARIPPRLGRVLAVLPAVLLGGVVLTATGHLPLDLVDLEAFDAWSLGLAGVVALAIAIGGLAASAFVPMAYCRYGCPTGALLQWLRRAPRRGIETARDGLAVILLLWVALS